MEAAASIIGLLAIGAKVYVTLEEFVSNCADAPSVAQATRDEVQDFRYALERLQRCMAESTKITPLGAAATDVNQLSLTLASCEVTFSQLEKTLDRLLPRRHMDTIGRLRWIMAGGNLSQLVTRIQQHKSTITLLLTIWMSESKAQTENCVERLNDLLTQVITPGRQPQSPAVPMMPIPEECSSSGDLPAPDIIQNNEPTNTTIEYPTTETLKYPTSATHRNIEEVVDGLRDEQPADLHSILFTSRPYRGMSRIDTCAISLASSQRRGLQWSFISGRSNESVFSLPYTTTFELSGVTLAETPDIATVSIPVHMKKLYNQWWYPHSGIFSFTSKDLLSGTRPGDLGNITSPDQFITALRRGNTVAVLRFLSQQLDLHHRQVHITHALRYAIRTENRAMTEILLILGLQLDDRFYSDNPLSEVLSQDERNGRNVSILTRCAPQPVTRNDRLSIFHIAAKTGNVNIIKLLLDRGIGVDETSKLGYTALQYSTAYGHRDVVSLLLDKGACPSHAQDTAFFSYDEFGSSYDVLCFGAFKGYKEIVSLLLERGAKVNRCGPRPHLTALQAGVLSGDEDIVNLLLERGANAASYNSELNDSLCAGAICGNERVVRLLLDNGAHIEKASSYEHLGVVLFRRREGNALEFAIRYRREAVVRTLLERGATCPKISYETYEQLKLSKVNGEDDILGLLETRGLSPY